MTTRPAPMPPFNAAFMPLLGTAGGFVVLVAMGFVGGIGAMMAAM